MTISSKQSSIFHKPLNINDLSKKELIKELEKGYADVKAGRSRPANEVFEEIRKDYHISKK